MSDKQFIDFLGEVVNNINSKPIEVLVGEYFPSREYLKKDYTIRNDFRALVQYKMTNLNKRKMKQVFKLVNQAYHSLYKNPSVLDNYFSVDVRKPIRIRFPQINGEDSKEYKMSKELVRIDYETKGRLMEKAREKVFTKNNNRTNVDIPVIIEILKKCLESENIFKLALALCICSGSRPIELYGLSEYSEHDDKWIVQMKMAKKNDLDAKIIKPIVHITSKEFIEKIEFLRKEIKNRTKYVIRDGKLHSTIQVYDRNAAKEMFGEIYPDFTFYTCRKLYGLISYEHFGRHKNMYGENISFDNWLNYTLGHRKNTTGTSQNYAHLSIN